MARSASINAPLKQAQGEKAMLWFGGSTALKRGQGLCYNWDFGTDATVASGERMNRVEVPTILNAPYFAGVAVCAYAASSGGQMIEIWLPGSLCNIWSNADTVIGVGRLTFEVGGASAGYFRDTEGFPGEGSCVPLQTATRAGSAGTCLAMLETGRQSGGIERVLVAQGAIVCMVGGVTMFTGASIGGNSTFAIVQGTYENQLKKFYVRTAITSNNLVITPATDGIQMDGSTALDTITLNAADETITLGFFSDRWCTQGVAGATEG